MTASLTLVVLMAVLFGAGISIMLERSLTRVLIGFLLLGNAANLLLLVVMGQPGAAPFYGADCPAATAKRAGDAAEVSVNGRTLRFGSDAVTVK